MPENTNEQIKNEKVETREQADRKKRTEKRDQSTLVTEAEYANFGEDSENFFESRVFDVEELLNDGTEDEIQKLNRLKEYGVTDEMIISIYKDMSGHVTTKTAALDTLSTIFDNLVIYISKLPNGIVIDPETGEIDLKASIAQRYEVGIYSNSSEFIYSAKLPEDFLHNLSDNIVKEFLETSKDKINYDDFMAFQDYLFLTQNFDNTDLKEDVKGNIDSSMEIPIGELDVSKQLIEAVTRKRESIANNRFEKEKELYEITSLTISYYKATGQKRAVLGLQIDDYYKKHPEMLDKVDVIDEDGNLKIPSDFKAYKLLYKFEAAISQLHRASELNASEFEKLKPKEKRAITIALFDGYSYKGLKNEDFNLLAKECEKKLHELFPKIDLTDKKKNKKENEIEFARIVKDILEIPIEKDSLTYTGLKDFCKEQMDGVTDHYLMHDKEAFQMNYTLFDLQNANLNFSYESAINNYFNDSELKLTKEAKDRFEYLYKTYTVNAWIDDRNKALKLRYLSIQSMKENYKRSPETPYIKEKLAELEEQEKDFWKENGEEFLKVHGNPQEWSKKEKDNNKIEYNHYKNNRVLAGITEFYTKDMISFQNGITYEKMSAEDKKAYIRNSLAIYSSIKSQTNDASAVLAKVVVRRFELMNKEDKKFVVFDENGNATINEDVIFNEYKGLSSKKHEWSSFEELLQASEQKKEKYVLKKLGEFAELKESDYEPIGSRVKIDVAYKKVEKNKIIIANKIRERKEKKNAEKEANESLERENQSKITDKEIAEGMKKQGMRAEPLDISAIIDSEKATKQAEQKRDEAVAVEKDDETARATNGEEKKRGERVFEPTPETNLESNLEINSDTSSDSAPEEIGDDDEAGQQVGIFERAKQIINNIFSTVFRRNDKVKKLPPGNSPKTKKDDVQKNGEEDKNPEATQEKEQSPIQEPINYLTKQFPIDHVVAQRGQNNDSNSGISYALGDPKEPEDIEQG